MLIKYRDRLTTDGVVALNLALKSGSTNGLQALTKFLASRERREPQLPFRELSVDTIRFHINSSEKQEKISLNDALTLLKPQGPMMMFSPVSEWRIQPDRYEQFLNSDAHDDLAFDRHPVLLGYSKAAYILSVDEGQTGRTYARSREDILDFVQSSPKKEDMLSDMALVMNFMRDFETIKDLEDFIDEAPDVHLDQFLDSLSLTSGSYFGSAPQEIAQKNFILQLNSNAHATLDFNFNKIEKNPIHLMSSPKQASENLCTALTKLFDFAKQKSVEEDAYTFKRGLEILNDKTFSEISEVWKASDCSIESYRLFAAAVQSDNFAGMGSWNDVQIDKDQELHRLTNEVVLRILEAAAAAVSKQA